MRIIAYVETTLKSFAQRQSYLVCYSSKAKILLLSIIAGNESSGQTTLNTGEATWSGWIARKPSPCCHLSIVVLWLLE